MSARPMVVAVAALFIVAPTVHAQSAPITPPSAQFRLVRCGPQRDAACLTARLALPPGSMLGGNAGPIATRWSATLAGVTMIGPDQGRISGATQPDISPVFGVPVIRGTSLGRAALRGSVTLAVDRETLVRVSATWRPPMISLPAFIGTADSATLPEPLRLALAAAPEPPAVRPLLALVLALIGVSLMVFVPRFLWIAHHESEEDMARQIAASRALLSTQEFEQLRGTAPQEGKPRKPEEPTRGIPVPRRPSA